MTFSHDLVSPSPTYCVQSCRRHYFYFGAVGTRWGCSMQWNRGYAVGPGLRLLILTIFISVLLLFILRILLLLPTACCLLLPSRTDGSVYKGTFLEDCMSGEGKMRWKDGVEYTGEFVANRREGFGKMAWTSGRWPQK